MCIYIYVYIYMYRSNPKLRRLDVIGGKRKKGNQRFCGTRGVGTGSPFKKTRPRTK